MPSYNTRLGSGLPLAPRVPSGRRNLWMRATFSIVAPSWAGAQYSTIWLRVPWGSPYFGAGGAALMTISRKTPLSIPGRISELKTLRKSFRLTRWMEGF